MSRLKSCRLSLRRFAPPLAVFSLFDMTLPRGMSAGLEREAIFGCCIDPPAMERHFLSRFRQSGGHREMHLPKSGLAGSSLWTEMPDSFDRSRKPVILAGSIAQAEAVLDVIEASMSLVVRTSAHRRPTVSPAMASWLRGYRTIACEAASIGQTFLWFVPTAEFSVACDALNLEQAGRRRSSEMSGSARPARRSVVADATLELPTSDVSWHPGLFAGTLIHDGGYRSESDGDYSWLWTGPSNHFRVLLTGVPPTSAELHVSVIKTEDVRNLSGLRMLINGRHVPHRFEPWSELSGKLVIDLHPPADDMTVLSLVCPHMIPDTDGGRLLGLCIDKIEMSS